jgi:hypothetical protein
MRGCKVKISIPLLLEQVGLKYNDDIHVSEASVDDSQTLNLALVGTDLRLPETEEGKPLPDANIICETVVSHFKVIEKISLSPQLEKKIDDALVGHIQSP